MNTKSTLHLKFLVLGHLGRQMLPLWCCPPHPGDSWTSLPPPPAGSSSKGWFQCLVQLRLKDWPLTTLLPYSNAMNLCYSLYFLKAFYVQSWQQVTLVMPVHKQREIQQDEKLATLYLSPSPRCLFVSELKVVSDGWASSEFGTCSFKSR